MIEEQYRSQLSDDPGNPLFADYGDYLRRTGRAAEGLQVCFAGLSANPSCHRGRLVLARIFYESGYLPFAVRELITLMRELPELQSLKNLIAKLTPDMVDETGESEDEIFAETEFESTELELIATDDPQEPDDESTGK